MSSRRLAREYALQALYSWDLTEREVSRALNDLWASHLEGEGVGARPAVTDEVDFALRLCRGVAARREEIDAQIDQASVNWRLPRMPVIDRNILRLAAYELLACHDVPASVSINEAVELAKRFGDKDSKAFVNGILDRIAGVTGRGGRRHGPGKGGERKRKGRPQPAGEAS